MKSKNSLMSGLVLAISAAFLSPMAIAAPGGCDGMGPDGGKQSARMAERMKERQQKLHESLKLNPEQEKAWVKFQESHPFQGNADRPDRAAMDKLTAPERAEKMLEQSRKHQDVMSKHVSAMKSFYDTLTPEQKKTFDEHSMMRPQRGDRQGRRAQGPQDGAPAQK
jgi:Spy/CpxP family protein refolding chaperone